MIMATADGKSVEGSGDQGTDNRTTVSECMASSTRLRSPTAKNNEGGREVDEATFQSLVQECISTNLAADDEEKGEQLAPTAPPSSQDVDLALLNEKNSHLQPVQVRETKEQSITVTVRSHVRKNLLKTLSSIVAHEVKDLSTEGDDLILVLSISDHTNVPGFEQQLQATLEESSHWEDCRRELLDSSRPCVRFVEISDAKMPLRHDTAKEGVSRTRLVQSSGGMRTKAPVPHHRDEKYLQHARSVQQMFADTNPEAAEQQYPAASEDFLDGFKANAAEKRSRQRQGTIQESTTTPGAICVPYPAASEDFLDDFKANAAEVKRSRQRQGTTQESATTPGAIRVPGQSSGNEWTAPSQDSLLWGLEEGAADDIPVDDNAENTVNIHAFKVDELAHEENVRLRILEEAVEADVIDQVEAKQRRQKRFLRLICLTVSLLAIAIGLGVAQSQKESSIVLITEEPTMSPTTTPTVSPRPTLEKVLDRGTLRCGTVRNTPGLSIFNKETNSDEGFNVDLCRAIAAAVFGDASKLEITPLLSIDRFEYLQQQSVDVLARIDTHTMAREVVEGTTGTGFSFSAPFLYSGLVFKGEPAFVDCAEKLDTFFGICGQLKICVDKLSSLEGVMDMLFPSSFLHRSETEIEDFVNGTCNVVATEPVYSHETVFRDLGYAGVLKSGTIPFSREPLALVTRRDDPEWSDLVNAVLQALMVAEVQHATQATAARFRATPELGNFIEGMFSDAIAAVGNYGELFSRHLDGLVSRTGLNSLNLNGSTGLLYSFPFGDIQELGHGPIQGGTLQTIRDRGYLRCGLPSNITGFGRFNTTSQKWSGLDVSFCRVVSTAVFADKIDANASTVGQSAAEVDRNIDFVSLSDVDQYSALASGDVDVLAGGMASFVNDVLEPTSLTGFSFSAPYFYGSPGGNLSDASSRSLVTRQDDSQWSTFVDWSLMSTIYAEERFIGRNEPHLMPAVNLFGDSFSQMFRVVVATSGNYGDIYTDALEEHIPRAGRNQLNSNEHHGPQQYPYTFP